MTTTINNEHKKLNVPNLRFPEFQGEWEEYTLQDVVTFSNGKAHENCVNDDGDYILVNSKFVSTNGQVQKRVTSQLSPLHKSQFVMVMSDLPNGKALAKCFYVEEDNKYTLNQRVCSFTSNDGNVSRFLMYQINRNKYYLRFDDGINQTNLKKSEVLSCPVFIPIVREQEKIATLLCKIDERIATQNKIIEDLKKLKCAIIDYTFDNKTQSHRKRILLSDVSAKITRRNTDNQNFNVLSNSANQGIIPQNEVFDREIANENNTSNYFVISQNDFVYNPRKSVTAPYGPINRYNGETNGVISPLYLCFRCYGIDVEYLGWYFKSDSWHKYVYQNGDTGVRHDRVSIKDEIFFSMPLYLHSTEEQMEIAKRLNKIESFVSQEEKYLFLLRSQKLYLLQQMFI